MDNGKICDAEQHAYQTIFKCDQLNCEQFCCRKCMGKQDNIGKRYCILCAHNLEMAGQTEEEPTADSGKPIGTFDQTITVKRDK